MAHRAKGMGQEVWNRATGCPMHSFSLVVCRHPVTNRWLAVHETKNRGWWLPGGFVECGDDHFSAAVRETKEEAGITVTLQGILRIENEMTRVGGRQRVIFYAEPSPSEPEQQPKHVPDNESLGAAWLSVQELEVKREIAPADGGLRGTELLHWAKYIENGGKIYPLDVFTAEHTPIPAPPLLDTDVKYNHRRVSMRSPLSSDSLLASPEHNLIKAASLSFDGDDADYATVRNEFPGQRADRTDQQSEEPLELRGQIACGPQKRSKPNTTR